MKQQPANSPAESQLMNAYQRVRTRSEALCAPLNTEDYVIQSMPDVSPTKWHLAHMSWFFETFILAKQPGYQQFNPQYAFLFNSYYEGAGERHQRAERGLLSRPSVAEVYDYRQHVDTAMQALLSSGAIDAETQTLVTLGLTHEQQHQELLLMDIKHVFSRNPLLPSYQALPAQPEQAAEAMSWQRIPAGVYQIGQPLDSEAFCFDNETPQHRVFLPDYACASQAVNHADWLAFMADGGYERPELWLSDGWAWRQQQHITAPLYWQQQDGDWWQFTLQGLRALELAAPVCHLSYYEAEAYARWAQARLPTEAEWEVAAQQQLANGQIAGQFADGDLFHPQAQAANSLFGGVWVWTSSAYAAYPGFKPLPGTVGEYNGKFMANQYVLRGGSCVTPADHIRASYRNFFYPAMRWQFAGLRLARDEQ